MIPAHVGVSSSWSGLSVASEDQQQLGPASSGWRPGSSESSQDQDLGRETQTQAIVTSGVTVNTHHHHHVYTSALL